MNKPQTIRVALLNLYEGQVNEGMRCIRDILQQYSKAHDINLVCKEFDVRLKCQLPDLHHDIYISSGGPGSPRVSGHEWERLYFEWIYEVEQYNKRAQGPKKHVYFICHSFQLAVQYFKLASVTKRKSTAFGVFPMHMLPAVKDEPIFTGLQDPFYAVDSRNYQVIEPDPQQIDRIGASIL